MAEGRDGSTSHGLAPGGAPSTGGAIGTRTAPAAAAFELNGQQREFFETFGFLQIRDLFAPHEVDLMREGFEEVFASVEPQVMDPSNEYHRPRDPAYRDRPRLFIPAFIDRTPKLAWLRDDARVRSVAAGLLGADYVYAESDGNIMSCDVYWHVDAYGAAAEREHVKLFFYLDRLRGDDGALRVLPGTHFREGAYGKRLRKQLTLDPDRIGDYFGVAVDEIPSWTLDIDPGDVIVGNFRTLHASFAGGVRRRLFTVNFGAAASDPGQGGSSSDA